uniref:Retrovirus-related Pol polyprotein from transposon TNT 1-94 n=1 Tax=Cajanus cajan TaxID=3821 RepID=A0A151TI92_CAJCA|nr:Retrovirus-related Pol polyprotein from transposon TNT 1-94 [Cajanus cajan]
MVTQEESHKAIVHSSENPVDALGCAATTNIPTNTSKLHITCTHCRRLNHDVSRCYKLHGYPDRPPVGRDRGCGRTLTGRSASASAHATQSGASFDDSGPSKPLSIIDFTPEMLQRLMSIAVSSKTPTEKLCGTVSSKHSWLLDSGASQHMTGTVSLLSNIRTIPPCSIGLPNGDRTLAIQCGDVRLTSLLLLTNVLYVSSLTCNLISISQMLHSNDCMDVFNNSNCFLQDQQTRRTIGQGVEHEGVYVLCQSISVNVTHGSSSFNLWHRCLGHPSQHYLDLLPFVSGSNKIVSCDVCCRAKQTRYSFPINKTHSLHFFDLIHCDLWGPYRTVSASGAHYFLTIFG